MNPTQAVTTDADHTRHDELRDELASALHGDVAFDDYSRQLFSRDASMYSIEPIGVVFPRDADDVSSAVRIARRYGVTITARGAGTSLAGQTTGTGLILDLSRYMRAIVDVDPARRLARVQPGVVQDELNAAVGSLGLMFGPDTSTSNRATIGGMIGNNSAGSGSLTFGMTVDHVISLDVVLADGSRATFQRDADGDRVATDSALEQSIRTGVGEIAREYEHAIASDYPKFWRRACGYRLDRIMGGTDLVSLLVGSEGTLAIVVEATVRLVVKPKHTVFAVGHFHSIRAAIDATQDALELEPSQVELMDKTILDLSRTNIEYSELGQHLTGDPTALLFVSFSGDNMESLVVRLDQLEAVWREHGHGYHVLRAVDAPVRAALLKVRKASLGLLMANSVGSNRPLAFVEDTAVDPAVLGEYTSRFQAILDAHGLQAGFYGHASVGCLHVRPFVDLSEPLQRAAMREVAVAIKDLVAEFGGVNSSEHGDGLARSEFNREIFGDDLYTAMVRTEELFDPYKMLNPGKIVDAPPMDHNLRDANLRPAGPITTTLDFTVLGGMRGASDRCMNIGLCRKTQSGVMCPSYQVTRDEEQSTRGRANALTRALTAEDPSHALADPRLHEILDTCLMCNACKTECPLGVDVAALKAEALDHKHRESGVPIRSRVFANIRALNHVGAVLAPLSNAPGTSKLARRILERTVGITENRPLPRFTRRSLIRWDKARTRPPQVGRSLTFLADSFTTFTESEIGIAAVELLELAGWNVRIESGGCCGRAAYSKGLLDQASSQASALVQRLQADPADTPLVGVEPSCIFTVRDEFPRMLSGNKDAERVASRVAEIEKLLCDDIDAGRLKLQEESWLTGKRILYHGHCHQKAAVGVAATLALLSRIPGVTVEAIESGCCGMAGSFGFEAEHYEMSMQIGGDRLFPAVRQASEDTVVAAVGVSCRQQIAHGTERVAQHPLLLLRSVVASGD